MKINICHLVQQTIPCGHIQYDGRCLSPFSFEDITTYLCFQHSRENLGTEVCVSVCQSLLCSGTAGYFPLCFNTFPGPYCSLCCVMSCVVASDSFCHKSKVLFFCWLMISAAISVLLLQYRTVQYSSQSSNTTTIWVQWLKHAKITIPNTSLFNGSKHDILKYSRPSNYS